MKPARELAPLYGNTRRVTATAAGLLIGHVEKLDRSDPNVKRVFALARLAKGRAALAAKHKTLSGKIQQAQKQSATKRSKGKRETVRG